jgi:hypothetical protein
MKALSKPTNLIKLAGYAAAIFCAAGFIYETVKIFHADAGYELRIFFMFRIWALAEFALAIPFLLGMKINRVLQAVSLFFCAFLVYSTFNGILGYIANNIIATVQNGPLAPVDLGATIIELSAKCLGALLIFAVIIHRWPYRGRA